MTYVVYTVKCAICMCIYVCVLKSFHLLKCLTTAKHLIHPYLNFMLRNHIISF